LKKIWAHAPFLLTLSFNNWFPAVSLMASVTQLLWSRSCSSCLKLLSLLFYTPYIHYSTFYFYLFQYFCCILTILLICNKTLHGTVVVFLLVFVLAKEKSTLMEFFIVNTCS